MMDETQLGLHSNLLESQYSLKRALEIAGKAGYDGYEVDIGFYEGTVLEGGTQEWTGVSTVDELLGEKGRLLANWAAEADIELNSLCLGTLWKYNPASRQETEIDHAITAMSNAVRAAAVLETEVVLIPTWKPKGVPPTEARHNLVAAIEQPLKLAKHYGVTLALENIRQTSDFFTTTTDLIEIVDAVDSEYCGLYYDVANARMSGFDPAAEIRKIGGSRIAQVHLKDAILENNDTVQIGAGDLDFSAIRNAFEDVNYTGYFTIESGSGFIHSSESDRAQEIAVENVNALQSLGFL